VIAAYTGQAIVPAVAGCLGGVALGNLLSVPLLHKTADVYGVGHLGVPLWVNVGVPSRCAAWSRWLPSSRRSAPAG